MAFLGTRAGSLADLALIFSITGFVLLFIGVLYAKRRLLLGHFEMSRLAPEGWLGRGMFKASKGTKINSDVPRTPIKPKTTFDNVFPKFDVFDIMECVAVHGLVQF